MLRDIQRFGRGVAVSCEEFNNKSRQKQRRNIFKSFAEDIEVESGEQSNNGTRATRARSARTSLSASNSIDIPANSPLALSKPQKTSTP